jgi:hypothetical protein
MESRQYSIDASWCVCWGSSKSERLSLQLLEHIRDAFYVVYSGIPAVMKRLNNLWTVDVDLKWHFFILAKPLAVVL